MPEPFIPPSFDISDRVAVVTGATRGLGLVMARTLAAAGAAVVVSSRRQEACDEVAAELRAEGHDAIGVACHVGDWDAVGRLAEAAIAFHGRVHVLINNAGMAPMYDRLVDIDERLWDKVFAVNLKGPFRLSALLGRHMREHGSGSIINVSSTGAVRPTLDIVPYSAAKAGLNTLTAGLADALGPEVRVNCLMPGPFRTDISEHWDLETFEQNARTFPLRRAGRPEEIAGAALYLASDASSYTTGAVIPIDGGNQWSVSGGGAARPDYATKSS